MHECLINDVSVKFPFEPYPLQRDYMQKIIECLENSANAILESPTGTGKTLSLLCATLAWVVQNQGAQNNQNDQKAKGSKPPTVIYASRTHSQLAQAMKEFKRSPYNFISATVIGSRDQLCIQPELKDKSNADKILECKSMRKKCQCGYYNKIKSKMPNLTLGEHIMDIEDLRRFGKDNIYCPYYMAKEKATVARMIFLPYNYLLDPKLRDNVLNDINLNGAIVILDEAHNVENVCERSASTSITSTELIIAIRDMKWIVNKIDPITFERYKTNVEAARRMKASIHKLVKTINELTLERAPSSDVPSLTHSGGYMFELLQKANITEANYASKISFLENLLEMLFERKKAPQGIGLKAFSSFLKVAFSSSTSHLKDRIDQCYNVHIENELNFVQSQLQRVVTQKHKPNACAIDGTGKVVNFWCFSAAFGIHNMMGQHIRSLILTSGTLSPMKPIIAEMDIPVTVQLANPHIIEKFQVYATAVRVGALANVPLKGGYKNRDNEKYIESLGKSIIRVAKITPDGLLVFFKSYDTMERYQNIWRTDSMWAQIENQKPIFTEPRNKKDLKHVIHAYNASVNQHKGAIFMAVLRGKVSEGLDFADMYGRACVVVGIPFGLITDQKIKLKQQYLNKNRTRANGLLTGEQWYRLDAIRAVNQAVGRVIRHRNDYGAILFLDDNFNDDNNKEDISAWIKENLSDSGPSYRPVPFMQILSELSNFFKVAEEKLPKPEPKEQPEDDLSDDDELDVPLRLQQVAEMLEDEPTDDDDSLSDDARDLDSDLDLDFDFDENQENDRDGMLAESQVIIHDYKRKSSDNAINTNSQENLSNGTSDHSDESKRVKKMDGSGNETDINMNSYDQNHLVKDDYGSVSNNNF